MNRERRERCGWTRLGVRLCRVRVRVRMMTPLWMTMITMTLLGMNRIGAAAGSLDDVLREVARGESAGAFAGAEALLEASAGRAEFGASERATLEFERERFRRIRRDFRLTRAQVVASLEGAVRDFTVEEFERWLAEGRFDRRTIDGEEWFFVSSVSNLFFRHPELEVRRLRVRSKAGVQHAYLDNAAAIRRAAQREGRPYVLPKRFAVRMRVSVGTHAVGPGERIAAWLPVPRRYPFQGGFELARTSSPVLGLEPEDSPIRSVHLEQPAGADGAAVFEIGYRYEAHGVWFDLQPAESRPSDTNAPGLRPYLGESPHVRFTPEMRLLMERLAGGETNAVVRVRRFHHWIAENVRYSFAPEYSTIRDLGESCRAARRGDCGQVTFLFMTLCRMSGVPARWQSGWAIFPGDETIHDWCEIHLEPWGWVPVDPYMGMYAMQYATSLTRAQREALRDFYLGGLTQHRMSANADHNQPLRPTKRSIRSDPVDFQRGEVEAGGRNLYFDRFDYDLTWEEVPGAGGALP